MNKIAVIGFGCAAVNAVKAIRAHGCADPIHVYAPADTPPENPMLTTYYASNRVSSEGRYPFGTVEELQKAWDLTLHLGEDVARVDVREKTLTTAGGKTDTWTKLLIASGASPWAPPMEGDGGAEAFPMRTMADAQALKDRLAAGDVRSALVVGASMIGIKAVELFVNQGIHCSLCDIAPHIFPLAALDGTAAEIEHRLTEKGVALRLGAGVAALHRRPDGGYTARFSDGGDLNADLVVLCVGTRANLPFLIPGQLKGVRGVAVDEHMRASAPDVYAAGDCCEGMNLQTGERQIIGLWASAGHQGRTAGTNIAGGAAFCDGGMVQNITHFFDNDFISVGDKRMPGKRVAFTAPKLYIEAIEEDGQLRCVNLLGGHRVSGVIRAQLWKAARGGEKGLSPEALGLLQRDGVPGEFIKLLGGTGK